ncbi:hypothetical protein [Rhodococcus globerulus]|uniref:hypothetical protein n=1 Tax=Rhodococcus globerulus TaxID=33008 RepID=UPI001FAF332E|nr:hypothetical protein [Rhodococcus globerulus]
MPRVLEFPLVVATTGTVPRRHTEVFLRRHGLNLPSVVLKHLMYRLHVLSPAAVTRVVHTRARAAPDLDDGTLVRLPQSAPGTAEPVGLFRRTSEAAAGVETLAGILRRLAAV